MESRRCQVPQAAAARIRGYRFGPLLLLGLACHRHERAGALRPNYSEDIAPLIQHRCLPCHDQAAPGIAASPPALTSYTEVKSVAEQLLLAVERRRMPPWGADATGLCGEYDGAAWIERTELATLRHWVNAGAPNVPVHAASLASSSPGSSDGRAPQPSETDFWLQAPPYAPQLGTRATRCFAVEVPLQRSLLLAGLRVETEPLLGVQQLELYALDAAGAARAQALDAADEEPGWSCYGAPGVPGAELVASWSWPRAEQAFPPRTGIELLAAQRFVLLVRYNLVGTGMRSDPVSLRVQLLKSVRARKARLLPLAAPQLRLPAGQLRAEVDYDLTVPRPLELLGVVPHLHTLGRSLTLERRHGAERSCLSSFGHWNVYSEQLFRYRVPIQLEPGDELRARCVFDTRSRTEAVLGGPEMDQEECLIYAYVTER